MYLKKCFRNLMEFDNNYFEIEFCKVVYYFGFVYLNWLFYILVCKVMYV